MWDGEAEREQGLPADSRLRIVMLHGAASNASLQEAIMEATGWATNGVEFLCIDGPQVCPPAPPRPAAIMPPT